MNLNPSAVTTREQVSVLYSAEEMEAAEAGTTEYLGALREELEGRTMARERFYANGGIDVEDKDHGHQKRIKKLTHEEAKVASLLSGLRASLFSLRKTEARVARERRQSNTTAAVSRATHAAIPKQTPSSTTYTQRYQSHLWDYEAHGLDVQEDSVQWEDPRTLSPKRDAIEGPATPPRQPLRPVLVDVNRATLVKRRYQYGGEHYTSVNDGRRPYGQPLGTSGMPDGVPESSRCGRGGRLVQLIISAVVVYSAYKMTKPTLSATSRWVPREIKTLVLAFSLQWRRLAPGLLLSSAHRWVQGFVRTISEQVGSIIREKLTLSMMLPFLRAFQQRAFERARKGITGGLTSLAAACCAECRSCGRDGRILYQ